MERWRHLTGSNDPDGFDKRSFSAHLAQIDERTNEKEAVACFCTLVVRTCTHDDSVHSFKIIDIHRAMEAEQSKGESGHRTFVYGIKGSAAQLMCAHTHVSSNGIERARLAKRFFLFSLTKVNWGPGSSRCSCVRTYVCDIVLGG